MAIKQSVLTTSNNALVLCLSPRSQVRTTCEPEHTSALRADGSTVVGKSKDIRDNIDTAGTHLRDHSQHPTLIIVDEE